MEGTPATRAFMSRLSYIQWTCIMIHSCVIAFLLWFVFIDPDNGMIWEFGPSPNLRMLGITIDTWPKYSGLLLLVTITRCTEDLIMGMMSADLSKNEIIDGKQNPLEAYKQSRLRKAFFFIVVTMFLKSIVIWSRVDLAFISMVISILSLWCTADGFKRDDELIDEDEVISY